MTMMMRSLDDQSGMHRREAWSQSRSVALLRPRSFAAPRLLLGSLLALVAIATGSVGCSSSAASTPSEEDPDRSTTSEPTADDQTVRNTPRAPDAPAGRAALQGVGVATTAGEARTLVRANALDQAAQRAFALVSSDLLEETSQQLIAIDGRQQLREEAAVRSQLSVASVGFVRGVEPLGEEAVESLPGGQVQVSQWFSVPEAELDLSEGEVARRIVVSSDRLAPAEAVGWLQVAARLESSAAVQLALASALRRWVREGGLDADRGVDAILSALDTAERLANRSTGANRADLLDQIATTRTSFARAQRMQADQAAARAQLASNSPTRAAIPRRRLDALAVTPIDAPREDHGPIEAFVDLYVSRNDQSVEPIFDARHAAEATIEVGEAVKVRVHALDPVVVLLFNFDSVGNLLLMDERRLQAGQTAFLPGEDFWAEIVESSSRWDAFAVWMARQGSEAEDELLAFRDSLRPQAAFEGTLGLPPTASASWIEWLTDPETARAREAAAAASTLRAAESGLIVSRPYTERAAIPRRRASPLSSGRSTTTSLAGSAGHLRRGTSLLLMSWRLTHVR